MRMTVVSLAAMLTLAGCERSLPVPKHEVIGGLVLSVNAATGEILLQPSARPDTTVRPVQLQFSSDSELYVQDEFSALERLQQGDWLDALAYPSVSAGLPVFVINVAHVERAAAPGGRAAPKP